MTAISSERPTADAGPIRVAQLVTTLARGGAQATVIASADMADVGVDVTLLAGTDDTGEGTFWGSPELAAATVVPVPTLVRSISPANDLLALWWLVRWLRAEQPDVLHTHSSKAGVLGRLAAAVAGIPCAHTVHGWGPIDAAERRSGSFTGRLAKRAVVLLERVLARSTARMVVVGLADRRTGIALRIGRADRYRLIRSGVDLSTATEAAAGRAALRRELGVDDRFVVGMVARMSPQKDHETLIEAFAAFSETAPVDPVLVLVGDGPERERIERMIAEAGLADRVRLLGERTDAARLVAAFDVSVLSSRWEGMPRTVVEAAACGVPIVATDVGSVADLVVDGVSGRLVVAGDVTAMADGLRRVALAPGETAAVADEARRRSTAFSVEWMRADLAALWHEVGGRSHGSPAPSMAAGER